MPAQQIGRLHEFGFWNITKKHAVCRPFFNISSKLNVLCFDRILKTLCRKLKLPEDFDYQQLARLTPGYVGADLMALCREAAMNAVNRVLLENMVSPQRQSQSFIKEISESRVQTDGVTDGDDQQQYEAEINPVSKEGSRKNHMEV